MPTNTRTVGERGQVTIPKELRERFDIQGGDEVIVREGDGRIVLEKPVNEADLAEGYRVRADEMGRLASEMDGVSAEATDGLGGVPEWEE